MKHIIFFSLISSLLMMTSCAKDSIDDNFISCQDTYLSHPEYEPYDGQPLSCKFYMVRYRWEHEEYYIIHNDCADMLYVAVNCQGEEFDNFDFISTLFTKAENLGIIAVYKP